MEEKPMKLKRILPAALALTLMTSTPAAGAAYRYQCNIQSQTVSKQQSQWQWLQKICSEYGISLNPNVPNNTPEVKPDTPEVKPDTPEVKPDAPEVKPDTPEVKPDTPEVKPDTPEVKPDTPEVKPDTPEVTPSQNDFATQVVNLVNAERQKAGLSAVTVDASVQRAAQVRAQEQVKTFSHTRPNGTSCFTALSEAGVNYRGAGENIAYGQTTPQAVMSAWMNSSGHRANILNAKFQKIGVGYVVVNGVPYWAQMFTY